VRLQSPQRQVAAGESWRQANDARFWYRHARIRSIRRCERSGLRTSGTELSFLQEVTCLPTGLIAWRDKVIEHKTAIFRQIHREKIAAHHDALEFPDGRTVLLTTLCEGQQATVLQLPAEPKTAVEAQSQRRVAYMA
jgi:hypothetical protein